MAAKPYRPKKTYRRPPDSVIVREVARAGAAIAELSASLDSNQGLRTDAYSHMVNLFTSKHELGYQDTKRYVAFDAKSSKPADVILRVMGMLTVEPKFQYVPPATGPKDEVKAEEIERFINHLYPWLFRKYGERWDFASQFWALLVGRGYLQQSYDPFYWDKSELRRRPGEEDAPYNERNAGYRAYQGPPIFVESIDPRMIHEVGSTRGVRAWVKHYHVERFELDEAFWRRGKQLQRRDDGKITGVTALKGMPGEELPPGAETPSSDATDYYEYIDDVYCYYVIDGEVVDHYKHDGGIRIFPCYGLPTGFREPHLKYLGILWAVRNEIPYLDFMRTLWANKAYVDVFPQLLAQLDESDEILTSEDGHPRTWEIEPGTIKQVRGTVVNALRDAASSMDFRAFIDTITADVDLATISGLARGFAGAQQPGYSINQLTQAMRTLWKPITISRHLQMSAMAEHALMLMKHHVRQSTGLYVTLEDVEDGRPRGQYIELDPDNIPEYIRVEAQMEPDLPIDKQGTMLTMSGLYEKGHATWEELTREGFNKTNPRARWVQAMRDQFDRAAMPKAIEDAMALGRMKLGNEVLKERGLDKLNVLFGMDLQRLKEARAGDVPAQPGAAQPTAPGMPAPPQVPGGNMQAGSPILPPEAAGGSGIVPTVGANPNNPTPGPRL